MCFVPNINSVVILKKEGFSMPEVQNVGTVDYAQYQPSQYKNEDYVDNAYNTQPQVYDESVDEIKTASKSRLGATLLTALIIGGGALWGGYAMGKSGAKKELKELQSAVDKYKEFLEKQAASLENQASDLEKQADEVVNTKFGGYKFGKKFANKVKEELGKLKKTFADLKARAKDATELLADDAKEAAEKTADDAKKAVDETKKAAEDAAKKD